eukprot:14937997-Ditylum_brightwellii.AAC.1
MSDSEDDIVLDNDVGQVRNGNNPGVGQNNCRRINQQLRPLDSSLDGKPVMTRLQRIILSQLLEEEEMDDMNLNHLDAQIMGIIVPSAMNSTNTAYIYGNRCAQNRNNCSANNVHYSRLFLMRIIGTESEKLCYVMETQSTNN